MTATVKHRPLSHPVVRQRLALRPAVVDADPWEPPNLPTLDEPHRLPPVSAVEQARLTERIEQMAGFVRSLDEVPLTILQRRLLRVIGEELLRRADVEVGYR